MSTVSKLAAVLVGATAVIGATWPSATLAGSIPTQSPRTSACPPSAWSASVPPMQARIDAGEIAGVVTLVARRGRIVHFEAYGYSDIAKRSPMRTDHIFGLASSSKPITAVAIMMLVERGDIRLSDPVSRFIPEFAARCAGGRAEGRRPRGRLRSRAGDAADHRRRPLEAWVRARERRVGCTRRERDGATHTARHARHLHTEARRRAARFPARHVVALQRARRFRRAEPHRRGRRETTVSTSS